MLMQVSTRIIRMGVLSRQAARSDSQINIIVIIWEGSSSRFAPWLQKLRGSGTPLPLHATATAVATEVVVAEVAVVVLGATADTIKTAVKILLIFNS